MKTSLHLFLVLCTTVLTATTGFSQFTVQVLTVQPPANPVNCSNTIITVTGQNNLANYTLNPITFSVSGSSITVNIDYSSGLIGLPAIMPWTHNVNVGNLSPGGYTVTVNGSLDGVFTNAVTAPMTVASCCPAVASFDVNSDSLCLGDTVFFNSTSTGPVSGQSWLFNGSMITSATSGLQALTQTGSHSLQIVVTDGNCTDTNTRTIEVEDYPVVHLGNDTSICTGESLVKSLSIANADYLWSDGSTSSSGSIGSVGDLSVTVTSPAGCASSDTVSVLSLLPWLSIDLGADTFLCHGENLTLDAGSGYDSYSWSTGASSSSIAVGTAGFYSVSVASQGFCPDSDTVIVGIFNLAPFSINVGLDSCGTRALSAASASYSTVAWSTTETSDSISVSASGNYAVTVEDANGCTTTDTAYAAVAPLPMVDLGEDKEVCEGDVAVLSSNVSGTYLWSDNSSADTLEIGAGTHWLQVTDEHGCQGADTAVITEVECLGITSPDRAALRIFPNPSSGILYIDHPHWQHAAVFDLTGRELMSFTNRQGAFLDVSSLEESCYLLIVTDDTGQYVARFVKQ